jgi:sugar (pentulose or hexulose) kinase
MISIDGGLTKNSYFNRFLANALQKTVIVQESPELTGLGTARMAMHGAGLSVLPPLPAPHAEITPDAPLSPELKQRFQEAIKRAKNWK